MPSLSEIISDLNLYERERRAFIKARVKLENMASARVRSLLGYDPALSGRAEEGLRKRANAIVSAIVKGETPEKDADIAAQAADFVTPILMPIPFLKKSEDAKVKHMEELAKQLPDRVLEFVNSPARKGFGCRGLAVIVAICHGDNMQGFDDFPTISKVWKRCGLNSDPGVEEKQMYKLNRAQCFAFIYDPVVRQQWAGDKDEDGNDPKKSKKPIAVPAHATGPYGAIYGEAKKRYLERVAATEHLPEKIGERRNREKWVPMRAELAARRYMAKCLLEDLWQAWRGFSTQLITKGGLGRADSIRREAGPGSMLQMDTNHLLSPAKSLRPRAGRRSKTTVKSIELMSAANSKEAAD